MLYYVFYTSTPLRNTSAYKIIESEDKLSFDRIRAKANDFIKENANQYIYDLFGHEDNLSIEEIEEFDDFINDCNFDYRVFTDKTSAQNFIDNDFEYLIKDVD